jgi:hypothetical protein
VLADAHSYGTGGTPTIGVGTCQAVNVGLVPGNTAHILPDGTAEAPANAPPAVQAMIAAGNRINHFPYSYGGGHGDPAQTMSQSNPNPGAVPGAEGNGGPGYDCSSATSYLVWGGGFGQNLLAGAVPDSTGLESVGDPGPGRWVTIYANAGHAYIEVAGSMNRVPLMTGIVSRHPASTRCSTLANTGSLASGSPCICVATGICRGWRRVAACVRLRSR